MIVKILCILLFIVTLVQAHDVSKRASKPFYVKLSKEAKSELTNDVVNRVRNSMSSKGHKMGDNDKPGDFVDHPYESAMKILEERVQERIDSGPDVLKCF